MLKKKYQMIVIKKIRNNFQYNRLKTLLKPSKDYITK